MTAKEYLKTLKKLDVKIRQKREQLEEINKTLMSELHNEINKTILSYENTRNNIINQIHMLDNAKHIELLYMHYAKFFELQKIAKQMNYSYDRIKHLHNAALKEFESKILNNEK